MDITAGAFQKFQNKITLYKTKIVNHNDSKHIIFLMLMLAIIYNCNAHTLHHSTLKTKWVQYCILATAVRAGVLPLCFVKKGVLYMKLFNIVWDVLPCFRVSLNNGQWQEGAWQTFQHFLEWGWSNGLGRWVHECLSTNSLSKQEFVARESTCVWWLSTTCSFWSMHELVVGAVSAQMTHYLL